MTPSQYHSCVSNERLSNYLCGDITLESEARTDARFDCFFFLARAAYSSSLCVRGKDVPRNVGGSRERGVPNFAAKIDRRRTLSLLSRRMGRGELCALHSRFGLVWFWFFLTAPRRQRRRSERPICDREMNYRGYVRVAKSPRSLARDLCDIFHVFPHPSGVAVPSITVRDIGLSGRSFARGAAASVRRSDSRLFLFSRAVVR